MFRAYKYRIYPNVSQRKKIADTFGVCRLVYNMGLNIKIESWRNLQKSISSFDLINQLPDLKKDYDWIKDVDSQSLMAALMNLDSAYKKFFRGGGFPKFKSKHGKQSFQSPRNKREIDFDKGLLTIPKLANIPIEVSRKFNGKIKTVTISKTPTGKYFASILVDTMTVVPGKAIVDPEKTIGIDLGIKDLAITSNGVKIKNETFLKKSIERLKVLQRRASKKKKGGKNRKKANLRVAVLHEKIRNSRTDYLHKITTELVRDNQATTFCIEKLSVSNMIKNHKLARSISDASWTEFNRQLKYKCDWAGKNVIEIGTFEPSSKKCSECGEINKNLTLSTREWICDYCKTNHDRDINAAKNIRKMGLAKYSGRGTPVVPVERPGLSGAMKQEPLKNKQANAIGSGLLSI